MTNTTNTVAASGAAILFEHEDGRYAVNPNTTGDPAWHRLGPVDVSAIAAAPAQQVAPDGGSIVRLVEEKIAAMSPSEVAAFMTARAALAAPKAEPAAPDITDAYAGAQEDIAIWKKRALEAEALNHRFITDINGPTFVGEPTTSDDAFIAREFYESQDDSLLLCASDLQHSAIYDNHIEMQSCIRAVADRITALASVIEGVERAALAAPAQAMPAPGAPSDDNALRCAVGNCMFNGEVAQHAPTCTATGATAAPAQAGEYPAGTGNPEADRIIGRLASSDPDFDDCADAVALIHKLVAEIKGPDGFATWKDAAVAERVRRVEATRIQAATEHPPLPRHDWCLNCSPAMPGYTADQMHAYADATCAARVVYSRSMDLVRTFWQQHTESDALSMTMAELHDDVELVIRAARKPLEDGVLHALYADVMTGHYADGLHYWRGTPAHRFARAIEQAHGITAAQKGCQHGTE